MHRGVVVTYRRYNTSMWCQWFVIVELGALVISDLILSRGILAQRNRQGAKAKSDLLELFMSDISGSPPNENQPEPTVVDVDLEVTSFDSVNEASMDFTIAVRMHLEWEDPRIAKKSKLFPKNTDYIEVDSYKLNHFWVPDIYFPNEKKAEFHDVMNENKMMKLSKNGMVSYTARLSLTLSCPMNLRTYPFDKQTCSIMIESFGYTADRLLLRWAGTDIQDGYGARKHYTSSTKGSDAAVKLGQFELPTFEITDDTNYSNAVVNYTLRGQFSFLKADFHLIRRIGYYLIQMYIPSLLIVMLSWVSFWLNVNSVPGRVSLGVLSVLTISTQSSTVNASLPRVSYIKAIDIWMTTCLIFVFAALLEFSIANVISRAGSGRGNFMQKLYQMSKLKWKKRAEYEEDESVHEGLRKRGRRKEKNGNTKDIIVNMDGTVGLKHPDDEKPGITRGAIYAMYIDVACRILFPVMFGVFNVVYWVHYLNISMYMDGIDEGEVHVSYTPQNATLQMTTGTST